MLDILSWNSLAAAISLSHVMVDAPPATFPKSSFTSSSVGFWLSERMISAIFARSTSGLFSPRISNASWNCALRASDKGMARHPRWPAHHEKSCALSLLPTSCEKVASGAPVVFTSLV